MKVNIPLLDTIKQIPSYAKFLEDICTVKQNLNVQKKTFLTEQVSALIQHKISIEIQRSRLPYYLLHHWYFHIEKALTDLGASVSTS